MSLNEQRGDIGQAILVCLKGLVLFIAPGWNPSINKNTVLCVSWLLHLCRIYCEENPGRYTNEVTYAVLNLGEKNQ